MGAMRCEGPQVPESRRPVRDRGLVHFAALTCVARTAGARVLDSLADPEFTPPDAAAVMRMLAHARFSIARIWDLDGGRTAIESKVV